MTEGRDREAIPPRPGAGERADGSLVRLGVGLARLYATAWWRAAGWSFGVARQALGVADARARAATSRRDAARRLRAGAAALGPAPRCASAAPSCLRRSADVRIADDTHPAYERILGDLAPDEGRILRLLATEGPQPAVDVRTARPLNIGSKLVAAGPLDDRRAGGMPPPRPHARVPQQPLPAGADLVLARAPRGSPALPGARGAAGGGGGDAPGRARRPRCAAASI